MSQNNSFLKQFEEYFSENESEILETYFQFLRFKSISSEESFQKETRECAAWLMDRIREIGLDVELWETPGAPSIFAQNLKAGPQKPTLLIYNHYDVQPVDPLDLWRTPPFEPAKIDGVIHARGAQDNKGQCMYVFHALKAMLSGGGRLPINIKWIIEGEEECGSHGLAKILPERKSQLRADYLVVPDSGIKSPDAPSVGLGARGIATMDVTVVGSSIDLHSGTHGGRAYNPLHALAEVIAKLHDSDGRVTVPGFYDDVKELSPEEKELVDFSFNPESYYQTFALKATGGEKAYSPVERSTIRPTVEVNGMWGGYTGEGFKTVIPAAAHAKVSCRFVPNQDPQKLGEKVARYIESLAPAGIAISVSMRPGYGKAVRASPESQIVKAFAEGYSAVFGKPCKLTFEGGSIPIIAELAAASDSEVVFMGMGLESDLIHAPNEHFGWDRFKRGFLIFTKTLSLLAH